MSVAETPSSPDESPPDESPPDESPPDEFIIQESDLETVVGKRQFVAILYDANDDVIRGYIRQLSMIRGN